MDKEQQKALVKAWELHGKILRELRDLAEMNESLAYSCIRTAETIIDMMMVNRWDKSRKEVEAKHLGV